jgi:hypothetical protein
MIGNYDRPAGGFGNARRKPELLEHAPEPGGGAAALVMIGRVCSDRGKPQKRAEPIDAAGEAVVDALQYSIKDSHLFSRLSVSVSGRGQSLMRHIHRARAFA